MKNVVPSFLLFTTILVTSAFFACSKTENPKIGGLYSVRFVEGNGNFYVAKILASDSSGVYVKVYRNEFNLRPQTVDQSTLSMGTPISHLSSSSEEWTKQGFLGIYLLPLSQREFEDMQPKFMLQSLVTDDELEDYKRYKERYPDGPVSK